MKDSLLLWSPHLDQFMAKVHLNAIAFDHLFQRPGKLRYAENHHTRREEMNLHLVQNAPAAQVVGRQVHDLLRRTAALDRCRGLREERAVAGLELLHRLPGVGCQLVGVVARNPIFAQRFFEAGDFVPVELNARR